MNLNGSGFTWNNNAAGGNNDDWGYGVTIDNYGRIVVSGVTPSGLTLWRFFENGTLDSNFNNIGCAWNSGGLDYGDTTAIDGLDRITVAGTLENGNNKDLIIYRYLDNGTLDLNFNGLGYVWHNNANGSHYPDDEGFSLILDNNGRIVVTGVSGLDMATWCYK